MTSTRDKIIIKTSIIGIATNLILVGFKAAVGWLAGSIAIILDAVNNLTDAISSIVTIIGTKLASKAPDKKHPFGYGRVEYFSSIIVAAIILYAGILALVESFEKIIHPTETDFSIVSLVIIAVAVLVKLFLGLYFQKVGKKVGSTSLVASGKDALSDVLLSFATLVSSIISFVWHIELGGYLGIIIGLFIIRTAFEIFRESINPIIGERADPNLAEKLKKLINKYPDVQGTYDLSIHNYGPSTAIASAHIQVPHDMSAAKIHALTREITFAVYKKFGIVITIGIYASNHSKYQEIQDSIASFQKSHSEIKQIHGFFVDRTTKEVYFDIVVDFTTHDANALLRDFKRYLKKAHPKYSFNIILDADISD